VRLAMILAGRDISQFNLCKLYDLPSKGKAIPAGFGDKFPP